MKAVGQCTAKTTKCLHTTDNLEGNAGELELQCKVLKCKPDSPQNLWEDLRYNLVQSVQRVGLLAFGLLCFCKAKRYSSFHRTSFLVS